MEKKEEQKKPRKSGFTREMTGLFLLFWTIFLVLCLVSFSKNDPTLNHVNSQAIIHNKAGLFGAYVAGFLNEWFGLCSFLWPVFFLALAFACLFQRFVIDWRRWAGFLLLVLVLLEVFASISLAVGDFSPSGIIGRSLYSCTTKYLNPVGAGLLWLFFGLIALQLILARSWIEIIQSLRTRIRRVLEEKREERAYGQNLASSRNLAKKAGTLITELWHVIKPKKKEAIPPTLILTNHVQNRAPKKQRKQAEKEDETLFVPTRDLFKNNTADDDVLGLGKKAQEQSEPKAETPPEPTIPEPTIEPPLVMEQSAEPAEPKEQEASPLKKLQSLLGKKQGKTEKSRTQVSKDERSMLVTPEQYPGDFPLPPLSILTPKGPSVAADQEDLNDKADVLMQTLSEFAIEGELARITTGPVVTLFEVRPASGVRVNKFLGISDDLARVLRTPSVRIITPVPGKDTVGIEIPNRVRDIVNFRELIESEAFRRAEGPLTMALGKDTAGNPVFANLAKMPHMLIAGATGTGKSVCLNSILASFLFRAQPKDVKLLLIDPKRVEMSVYADEPHLIHPVVNEPQDAKNALEWAISEMERRFKALSRLSVRKIDDFNKRLETFGENRPDELADLEHLPYIAIIVDELGELMTTDVRKDIENSIVRLAQLARACGIHMILATQRPSVNVVTGLIKANFPSRISFQVAQNADSRTILDTVGAEKLLGLGDMLFRPGDITLQRLHGAFLSDSEVCDLVAYWKSLTKPSYTVDFAKWTPEQGKTASQGDMESDDLFDEVLAFVTQEGTASISKIQRRFKIGFNRAARLVEALDARGILAPSDGSSKPRKVNKF